MKVTDTQIQRLFDFTRQHFVEYYDVQNELVDHLANAIEDQWEERPQLSFEEALQIEFKKFGVFGFQEIIEQRQTALGKKYNALVFSQLKEFFKLPKIIIFITAVFSLYTLAQYINFFIELIVGMIGLLIITLLFKTVQARKKLNQKFEKTGKKWMLEAIIYSYGNATSFALLLFQLPINILKLDSDNSNGKWQLIALSSGVVLIYFIAYIVFVVIPNKSEDYLNANYPEYKFN